LSSGNSPGGGLDVTTKWSWAALAHDHLVVNGRDYVPMPSSQRISTTLSGKPSSQSRMSIMGFPP
jgi:hypothetical protein